MKHRSSSNSLKVTSLNDQASTKSRSSSKSKGKRSSTIPHRPIKHKILKVRPISERKNEKLGIISLKKEKLKDLFV